MFQNLKLKFAGWSVWTLVKKLAGRFIPIAGAGAVGFFSKWAPESSSNPDAVAAAVTTLLWVILETVRNLGLYALKQKAEK